MRRARLRGCFCNALLRSIAWGSSYNGVTGAIRDGFSVLIVPKFGTYHVVQRLIAALIVNILPIGGWAFWNKKSGSFLINDVLIFYTMCIEKLQTVRNKDTS